MWPYAVLYAVCAIWVLNDAAQRRMNWILWAAGTLFLAPVGLPLYLANRSLKPGENREGGTAWNALRNLAVFWTFLMAFVAVMALIHVGQQAATIQSDAGRAGAAIGTALGLGMIAALWFFPMCGAVALGYFLKNPKQVEKGPTGGLVGTNVPPRLGPLQWSGMAALAILALWSLHASMSPENPQASSTADTNTPGSKWHVTEQQSPMDDSKTAVLMLDSDDQIQGPLGTVRPSLIVRCKEKSTDVYVTTGMAASIEHDFEGGPSDYHTVRIRLDDGPAKSARWSESTDQHALFADYGREDIVEFAKEIAAAETLTFEFTPFDGSPQVARFDLRGLDIRLHKVAEACGWAY